MFKKTKGRIVGAIAASLILFMITILVVVYLSSYYGARNDNREMLKRHVTELGEGGEGPEGRPAPPDGEMRPPDDERRRDEGAFRLATFYTVVIDENGGVTVDNGNSSVMSDEELVEAAKEAAASGKKSGKVSGLMFMVEERDGYTVVAFMDNTVTDNNMRTLLRNMLIAGGASIVVILLIAVVMANLIVKPLEENDARQRRFVSDAGHELKTPVTVIGTNTELLGRDIGENEWLSNIIYENERMSHLVTELLDLSRAERAEASPVEVDLSRVVTGEELPFESVAYERGKALVADVAEGVRVEGNPNQLRQLTAILLDNALKYGAERKEIKLTLRREKKSAILSVENYSDEIPPDKLEHLFERFYRADEARGDDGHYGLGLAIAKAITDAHRGTIGAMWRDGKMIFTVSLPVLK